MPILPWLTDTRLIPGRCRIPMSRRSPTTTSASVALNTGRAAVNLLPESLDAAMAMAVSAHLLEGISLRSRVLCRSASATLSPGSSPAHARTCRVHLPSAAEACARSPSSSAAILSLLDALSSEYSRAGLVGRRAAVVERGRGARARGHRLESYSV